MEQASAALTVELPAPGERPRRRGGRHLKVVPTKGRRRSAALPVLLCAGIVLVFMFAVAAMHALLIDGQLELDDVQNEVASETEAVERLRLQVAELEAPDRVLQVAQDRLGMNPPTDVGYVLPSDAVGSDAELLRVTPATAPPPPTTAPPVTTPSTLQSESAIDDAVTAALASAGVTPDTSTSDTSTPANSTPEAGTPEGETATTAASTPTTTIATAPTMPKAPTGGANA